MLQSRKSPSLKELKSDFYTGQVMSPCLFRKLLRSSKVIIDTNHPYQDGLTARFMWALGAGRKIITNNKHVTECDFCSKEQILILDELVTDEDIREFITNNHVVPQNVRYYINKFRIDNWIRTIFEIDNN